MILQLQAPVHFLVKYRGLTLGKAETWAEKKKHGRKMGAKKIRPCFFFEKNGPYKKKKTWAHDGRIIFKIKSRIPSWTSTLGWG